MVYKRYAKKNGKIYGPYYYESYREDGKVKKIYLGQKPPLSSVVPRSKLFSIAAILIVLVILMSLVLFVKPTGKITLQTEPNYELDELLIGQATITLNEGDSVQKDVLVNLILSKDDIALAETTMTFEEFLGEQIDYISITDDSISCVNVTIPLEEVCEEVVGPETTEEVCTQEIQEVCQDELLENGTIGVCEVEEFEVCENVTIPGEITLVCSNQTLENLEENCTTTNVTDYYYQVPGSYSRDILDLIDYRLTEPGDYVLRFSVPSLNIESESSFSVDVSVEEQIISEEPVLPAGNETEEGVVSAQATCPSTITSCCDITSGGTYTLGNNITSTGTCLQIQASNVTLDCQGKNITYATITTATYGIYSANNDRIHIKNCNINAPSGLNSARGIYIGTSTSGSITNTNVSTVASNPVGIQFYQVNGYNLSGLRVELGEGTTGFSAGIYVYESNNNLVNHSTIIGSGPGNPNDVAIMFRGDNNTATYNNISNAGYGIRVGYDHANNTVLMYNNINSSKYGLHIYGTVYNSNITFNTFDNNNVSIYFDWYGTHEDNNFANNTITTYAGQQGFVAGRNAGGNNISTSNTINGLPINYYDGTYRVCPDNTVQNLGSSWASFGISGCNNVTVIATQIGDVSFSYTNNSKILGLNVSSTYHGIYLYSSYNNLIANNTANNNYESITVQGGANNTFDSNTANSNTITGIYVWSSLNNTFINNTANNNKYGIYVYNSAKNNTFINNKANNNSLHGIYLYYNVQFNTLVSNTANNNSQHGIYLRDGGLYNVLIDNTANFNSQNGIYLYDDIQYSTLTNNTAAYNTQNGLSSDFSNFFNTFTGNNFSSNNQYGIYYKQSTYDSFINNEASNNFLWDWYSYWNQNNTVINLTTLQNLITFDSQNIALKGLATGPADPSNYTNIGKYINATNNTAPFADSFLYIYISYSDDDISHINESTLRIWKYNSSNVWQNETFGNINGVDEANNIVYANISTFGSTFATFGEQLSISSCQTISSAGTYLVAQNINSSDTCITINASDVELDCQGYTINGSNTDYGINVDSKNNVTIKNCDVTNFNMGIRFWSTNNSIINNNNASSNANNGIYLYSSVGNNLTNNKANGNVNSGIYLTLSPNNFLINNTAGNGNKWGIYLISSSNNNTLTNNTANANTDDGIRIWSSSNNTLTGNNANGNSYGFYLGLNSNYNNFTSSTSNNNTNAGIYCQDSSYNTFTLSTANNNSIGVYFYSSCTDNTVVTGSTYNNNYGIYLGSSSNSNIFSNHNVNNNTNTGIYLSSASYNRFTSNSITNNTNYGIQLVSSSNNNFTSNTAQNNTQWDFYSLSSSIGNVVTNLTTQQNNISFTSKDISLKGLSSGPTDPTVYRNISKYLNITNNSATSWIYLNVSYNNVTDIPSDVDESTLKIYRYNTTDWILANTTSSDNGVDIVNKFIYANITDFGSTFAPLGSDLPPNVTLDSPENNNITTSTSITFIANLSDDYSLTNASLWHDINGSFVLNDTWYYGNIESDADTVGLWHFDGGYNNETIDSSGQGNYGVIYDDTVGLWRFDENTGTTAYDETTYGNDGTLNGGAAWAAGKSNSGLDLDGDGDYVSVAHSTTLHPSSLSISAWIKPTRGYNATSEGFGIVRKDANDMNSIGRGYNFAYFNGTLYFFIGQSTFSWQSAAYNVNFSADTWYHVSATLDGLNATIYIDGTSVASSIIAAPIYYSDTNLLYAGYAYGNVWGNLYFNGTMDEVGFYNKSLSSDEIALQYSIGKAKFASWTNSSKLGDYAMEFDGVDDYVDVPESASLDVSNSRITVEAWVKRNSLGTLQYALIKDAQNGNGAHHTYVLNFNTNNKAGFGIADGSSSYSVQSASTVSSGGWQHIVGTYNGSDLKVYINGQLDNSTTIGSKTFYNNAGPLTIGRVYESGVAWYHFNGTIDEVVIYNRSLSSDEIWAHYKRKNYATSDTVNWTIDNIPVGTYNWNVQAFDDREQESWGENNWSFTTQASISNCSSTISSAGTYLLNQNLSTNGTCITIGADNVELDCQGYTIDGDDNGASDYGINNTGGYDYVTIKNCVITNFSRGIYFDNSGPNNANNGIILDNIVNSNSQYGISLSSSSNNTITNNTANNNQFGIFIFLDSNNNTLTNNTANNNSARGIYIRLSSNNTITNNTANNNTQYGIHLSSSPNNTITNNNANSNDDGINIQSSFNNNLTNNIANLNNRGIYLLSSPNNTFTSNIFNNNTNYGFYISSSSNNTFTNDNAQDNSLGDFSSTGNSVNNIVINLTTQQNLVSFTSKDISLKGLTTTQAPTDSSSYKNITKYLNITNNSATSWIYLNVSYNNVTDIPSDVDESTLKIYRYNTTDWILANTTSSDNGVDLVNKVVYANITEFGSTFAPLGSSSEALTGLLACQVNQTTCDAGYTDVLHMSNYTNAHAEMYNETDYADDYLVCCKDSLDVVSIGTNDTGTPFLRLSNYTNAHVEKISLTNYDFLAYISASSGGVSCSYSTSCTGNQTCLATISGDTDAQIADCVNDPYGTKICCELVSNVISNCPYNITTSDIYVVNQSLTSGGDCITINADEVIFDCNNNEIVGNGSGIGINLTSYDNATIKNCIISNFSTGILLADNSLNLIKDNTINDSDYGLFIDNSTGNNITDNVVQNNIWDLYLQNSAVDNNILSLTTYQNLVSFKGEDIAFKGLIIGPADLSGYRNISKYVNITNNSVSSWIYLNVSYDNSDVIADVNQSTLRIYKYNDSGWTQVSGINSVDTTNKVVYANITEFGSTFAPLGPISLPNVTILEPQNGTITGDGYVNFTINLSAQAGLGNATLYIYNESGDLYNQTTIDLGGALQKTLGIVIWLADGVYNWFWEVIDLVNNYVNTGVQEGENRTLTVDTTYPIVSIEYPQNTTYNTNVSELNYTLSDINLQACWYSLDVGVNNISITCGNNLTGLTSNEGSNSWTVYVNDSAGNANYSSVTFFKDTIVPVYDNLTESPISPIDYLSGQNYSFNATWTDNFGVGSVIFELNGTNYSTNNLGGDIYNFNISDLGVGNYSYRWIANDSAGNVNQTNLSYYLINKAIFNLTISITPSSLVAQGTQTNVSGLGCPSQLNCMLYRSGINVTNPDVATLNDGTYNYVYNTSGNENYTSANVSETLVVNPSGGGAPCVDVWTCDSWSGCIDEEQTRDCTSNCGNEKTETQACCVESTVECESWSECIDEEQTRDCTSNCGIITTETQDCALCDPEWSCTSFGSCIDESVTRTCTDLNNCGTGVGKPEESKECGLGPGKEGCDTNYSCGEWGECMYESDASKILQGVIVEEGYQERICTDGNDCAGSYTERSKCTSEIKIEVKQEEVCDTNTLTLFEESSKTPLINIDLESWRTKKLDVSFTQQKVEYCPDCYNGIRDLDEKEIDCGGSCRSCKSESKIPENVIPVSAALVIFSLILLMPILKFFFEDIMIVRDVRALIKSGEIALKAGDRKLAEREFRKIRWKHIQIGSENKKKLISNEIGKYHKKIKKFTGF